MFRELPEGAILFCRATEVYFSLNRVGTKVWGLLPPVCTSEMDLVARVAIDHPEVDPDVIAADVRRLIDDLLENGLLEVPQSA